MTDGRTGASHTSTNAGVRAPRAAATSTVLTSRRDGGPPLGGTARVEILHKELRAFWADALGRNWYVLDGAHGWTCEEPETALITIEDYALLGWQGDGVEKPSDFMRELLDRGFRGNVYSLPELLAEWRKVQTHTFVCVEIPREHVTALGQAVDQLGGVIVT